MSGRPRVLLVVDGDPDVVSVYKHELKSAFDGTDIYALTNAVAGDLFQQVVKPMMPDVQVALITGSVVGTHTADELIPALTAEGFDGRVLITTCDPDYGLEHRVGDRSARVLVKGLGFMAAVVKELTSLFPE